MARLLGNDTQRDKTAQIPPPTHTQEHTHTQYPILLIHQIIRPYLILYLTNKCAKYDVLDSPDN